MPRATSIRLGLVCVTALVLAPALTARAQFQQMQNAALIFIGPQAAEPDTKDAAGVYVRDSGAAMDELALGQKMERLSEWAKAADIFQEIQEKYPDRVVATDTDSNNIVRGYTSVQTVVQQELCGWPVAGLDVYRSRFGPKAQTLLDQAGHDDLAKLNFVYSRYFITEAGRKAGILLQNAYIERGEFAAAAVVGKCLLTLHPNLAVDRPAILYRTAQALHLAGDDTAAQPLVAELHTKFPTITATVRGADTVLTDSLTQVLAVAAPSRASASGDSYPTLGGDETRSLIPAGAAQPGAKLYSIDLGPKDTDAAGASRPANNPAIAQQLAQFRQRQLQQGAMLDVMPVVDQGQLFFQDNVRVYAVDLDSGLALPGWAATYPGSGSYAIGAAGGAMPPNQQLTLTVTDAAVLAVMGEPDSNSEMTGQPEPGCRLVCLDRHTGKPRWAVAPAGLPANTGQPLQSLQFGGAPLVVADNVYIVGCGGKGADFQDCYVLCFDLASGAFKWASYIASSDAYMIANGAVQQSTNVASLAYSDGRVFVSTNLGAAAAVDAFDGSIAWLRIYRDAQDSPLQANNAVMGGLMLRRGMVINGMGMPAADAPQPFYVNSALVRDGHLFVCPQDSRNVLVYNVDDGKEIARIDRKQLHSAVGPAAGLGGVKFGANQAALTTDPAVLIGVSGDTMYLGFDNTVVAVDWRLLQAGRPRTDWEKWDESLNSTLRGRPMLTDSRMYIPQYSAPEAPPERASLAWVKVRGGGIIDTYPADGSWTATRGPGNVLVSGDHVVIAGETSVDVYTDLDSVERKLDQQLAAAPADPDPRLKYAEVLFAAALSDQATQKLDEAIGLMGGTVALRNGPSRDRLFNDAMTFAQRLIQRTTPDSNPFELVSGFYDRAGQAAATPAQRVRYSLERADWESHAADYSQAITLYQNILSDPDLSIVTVVKPQDSDNTGSVVNESAAAVAFEKIKDTLGRGGAKAANAYAPFETAAQQRSDQAGNDPAALLAVAQIYPNSKVALTALFAAADQFEAAGDPAQAGRILRRIETIPHPDAMQDRLLESMARNAFAVPNRVDIGVARLGVAAANFGSTRLSKPMRLPDGTVLSDVTFQQAYEAARKYSGDLSQASLPDMNMPTAQEIAALRKDGKPVQGPFRPVDPAAVIDDITTLVKPVASFGRNDRIAGWSAGSKLRVFTVGSTHPAVTLPLSQSPHNLAYIGNRLCAWSDTEVASARWDNGQSPWKFDLSGLPEAAVLTPAQSVTVAPPANNPKPPAAVDQPEDVVDPFINMNGGVQIFPNGLVVNGMGQVVPPPPGAVVGVVPRTGAEVVVQVQPLSDRLILATSTGRVFALAISDGHLLWQSRVGDLQIAQLVASDDFVVLRSGDDTTVALDVLDADSGQKLAEQKYAAQPIDPNMLQFNPGFGGGGFQGQLGFPSLNFPINIALSGDGTLVCMTPSQLWIQDLYHPDLAHPRATTPLDASRQAIFVTSTQPNQLLIADGRILAVSDNSRSMRIYSLQNGASLIKSPLSVVTQQTALQPTNDHVGLSVAGTYVYAISQSTVVAYDLDSLANTWKSIVVIKPDIAQSILDKNYLLAMAGVGPQVKVYAWSRAIIKTKAGDAVESGNALFSEPSLSDSADITDMQAVDGGLYYFAGGTLKFARGSREP